MYTYISERGTRLPWSHARHCAVARRVMQPVRSPWKRRFFSCRLRGLLAIVADNCDWQVQLTTAAGKFGLRLSHTKQQGGSHGGWLKRWGGHTLAPYRQPWPPPASRRRQLNRSLDTVTHSTSDEAACS